MQDNYVNIWPVYFDDQMRHGYTNMLLLLTCDLLMSCDLLYVQIMLLQYQLHVLLNIFLYNDADVTEIQAYMVEFSCPMLC